MLDALEAGLIAGLLIEPGPGRVRFVHALVRDTLVVDVSRLRATRMHARIAAALDRVGLGDDPASIAALAHHYSRRRPWRPRKAVGTRARRRAGRGPLRP